MTEETVIACIAPATSCKLQYAQGKGGTIDYRELLLKEEGFWAGTQLKLSLGAGRTAALKESGAIIIQEIEHKCYGIHCRALR